MSYTIRGQIEDILFDTDVEEVHIKNILSLLTSEVEKEREGLLGVIGEDENVVNDEGGYEREREVRNQLRAKQRKALSDVRKLLIHTK